MFVRNVKEISRGDDWVKFLVDIDRESFGSSAGYEAAKLAHDAWLDSPNRPAKPATIMRFNFDKDRTIFKFETEPFSMKVNEYFSYLYEFGKWVDARIAERNHPPKQTLDPLDPDWVKEYMFTQLPVSGDHTLTIDENPPSFIEKKPFVEIASGTEVKSFISRIVGKHTV